MSFAVIVNLLLGLFFMWAILSIIAMNIQEWLSTRMQWRAYMLKTTIEKMLTDSVLADQFYNHPLIRSLFSGDDSKRKPSYITPNQFSQAMIDLLASTGTEASLLQLQLYKLYSICDSLPRRKRKQAKTKIGLTLGMVRKAIVSETGEDVVNGILGDISVELNSLGQDIPRLKYAIETAFNQVKSQKLQINEALSKMTVREEQSDSTSINRIRAGIIALSVTHPQLKQTLYALMNSVSQTIWEKQNELELIRYNLEEWFNANMNRLTGWYKRRTQIGLFLISLALVVIANVDSINLAHRLWDEPELRQTMVENIGTAINKMDGTSYLTTIEQLLALQEEISTINLPIGWTGDILTKQEMEVQSAGVCSILPQAENDIFGAMIFNRCYRLVNTPYPDDIAGWAMKAIGLLITALATSPGASFWFDLLKKIMNVRLSGFNPSETVKNVG